MLTNDLNSLTTILGGIELRKSSLMYFILPALLLSGCGDSNPLILEQMPTLHKSAIQANEENKQIVPVGNHSPSFVQKYLFGDWKVKKIVKSAWITTISESAAKKLVGTQFTFGTQWIKSDSKALKPILIQEDKGTTPRLSNPTYSQTSISKAEFETDNDMAQFKELGFTHNSINIIEIYTDKNYENQWSLGYIYLDPLNPKRLIITSNGYYFELQKIK